MEIVECGKNLMEINSSAEPDKDAAIRLFLLIFNPWVYATARIASLESIDMKLTLLAVCCKPGARRTL